MNEKLIHLLGSVFSIVGGVVAVLNFGWSVKAEFKEPLLLHSLQSSVNLPFRMILFIILETTLAYAFGKWLVFMEQKGSGIPTMMLFVIGLVSAWTSVFNVQWIFVGQVPDDFEFWDIYTLYSSILRNPR
jgi:hypothetical protein